MAYEVMVSSRGWETGAGCIWKADKGAKMDYLSEGARMAATLDEAWIEMAEVTLPAETSPETRREMCLYLWFRHCKMCHNIEQWELEEALLEVLKEEKKANRISPEGAWVVAGLVLGAPYRFLSSLVELWKELNQGDWPGAII